jgi:hypothetical protein
MDPLLKRFSSADMRFTPPIQNNWTGFVIDTPLPEQKMIGGMHL